MATQFYSFKKFAFERGGPLRLEVHWTYRLHEVMVKLDGVEIGRFTSRREFQQGRSFRLPDGSVLQVKYGSHSVNLSPLPDVRLDGCPLPDSFADPLLELKTASNAFIWGGVLTTLAGLFYSPVNEAWYTSLLLFIGVTSPLVGLSVRRRSRIALRIGTIYSVVGVVTLLDGLASSMGNGLDFLGSLFDVVNAALFVAGLSRGFNAMDALDRQNPPTPRVLPTDVRQTTP